MGIPSGESENLNSSITLRIGERVQWQRDSTLPPQQFVVCDLGEGNIFYAIEVFKIIEDRNSPDDPPYLAEMLSPLPERFDIYKVIHFTPIGMIPDDQLAIMIERGIWYEAPDFTIRRYLIEHAKNIVANLGKGQSREIHI